MDKPPILDTNVETYYSTVTWMWMQRDADLKWVVEWGDEECSGHEGYQYSLCRRQCSRCWQELQKLAGEEDDTSTNRGHPPI